MAITYHDGENDAMLSEINTTPLVDVMLVLLIIFLITIPVINTSVAVRLPRAANALRQSQPETVVISVDARGAAYWFDARLADATELQSRLREMAQKSTQAEVQIRGDARADYEAVARVQFIREGVHFTREIFASQPAQAIRPLGSIRTWPLCRMPSGASRSPRTSSDVPPARSMPRLGGHVPQHNHPAISATPIAVTTGDRRN